MSMSHMFREQKKEELHVGGEQQTQQQQQTEEELQRSRARQFIAGQMMDQTKLLHTDAYWEGFAEEVIPEEQTVGDINEKYRESFVSRIVSGMEEGKSAPLAVKKMNRQKQLADGAGAGLSEEERERMLSPYYLLLTKKDIASYLENDGERLSEIKDEQLRDYIRSYIDRG